MSAGRRSDTDGGTVFAARGGRDRPASRALRESRALWSARVDRVPTIRKVACVKAHSIAIVAGLLQGCVVLFDAYRQFDFIFTQGISDVPLRILIESSVHLGAEAALAVLLIALGRELASARGFQ